MSRQAPIRATFERFASVAQTCTRCGVKYNGMACDCYLRAAYDEALRKAQGPGIGVREYQGHLVLPMIGQSACKKRMPSASASLMSGCYRMEVIKPMIECAECRAVLGWEPLPPKPKSGG